MINELEGVEGAKFESDWPGNKMPASRYNKYSLRTDIRGAEGALAPLSISLHFLHFFNDLFYDYYL